jgi:hypothetical protein
VTDVLHFCFYVYIATLWDNSKKICGLTCACARRSLGFFFHSAFKSFRYVDSFGNYDLFLNSILH